MSPLPFAPARGVRKRAVSVALVWIGLLCATASAADSLTFSAAELVAASTGSQVRLTADGTAVELDWGELLEDDGPAAGYSYKPNREELRAGIRIRKDLLVPDPAAREATLLMAGQFRKGTIRLEVNGRPVTLGNGRPDGKNWTAYPLDPALLKPGLNAFVLAGEGRMPIARDDEYAAGCTVRTNHPNRSAVSRDDGVTWDDRHLGANGDVDGEYYVRLHLARHHAEGALVTPVADAGNLAGLPIAPPLSSVGPIRVAAEVRVGEARRIALAARTGPTPTPGLGWSEWEALGEAGGRIVTPSGRYVQVRAEMATANRLKSPLLRRLTLSASPVRPADWTRRLRVADYRNEPIVRTSIPFAYEPFDHPRLRELRSAYRLDEVTAGATNDFELAARLAVWAAGRWTKWHLNDFYPPWDALEILRIGPDGLPVGGFCQQRNLVFLQACESYGLPGRAVSIAAGWRPDRIRGGHEVVEIWSNTHRKWIYLDGDSGWYFTDEGARTPLSLLELHDRQRAALNGDPVPRAMAVPLLPDMKRSWTNFFDWPPFVELRLIPRSDFLAARAPLPLNQGMDGAMWSGFHAWTDAEPAPLIYGRRVARRGDWEWTLNQARLILEAEPEPGRLRVHLDTETPGFETFRVAVDGRPPRDEAGAFVWTLHPGRNTLEAWPRNRAGRDGIPSRVVLDYH